jgi:hypothetical protein
MIVSSFRSFDTNREKTDFSVIEVWKLINDGNSISIQVNSKSISGEKTMKLVYDKQWAVDYRFSRIRNLEVTVIKMTGGLIAV